jgi:hypothetical protein
MKAKIVAIVIVIFWLGMMFSLFRDRIPGFHSVQNISELTSDYPATEWRDQEECMRIFYKGIPVGAMVTTIQRVEENKGYLLSSRLFFQVQIWTFQQSVSMEASATLDPTFILDRFQVNFDINKSLSRVNGLFHNKRLWYKVSGVAGTKVGVMDLKQAPSMLDAIRSLVGKRLPLKVGNVYRLPVYDPMLGGGGGTAEVKIARREEIVLDGVKYNAFRIETAINKMTTVSWVDEDGKTLKRELIPDLVMQEDSKEDIISQYNIFAREASPPEMVTLSDFTGDTLPGDMKGEELPNIFQGLLNKQNEKDNK